MTEDDRPARELPDWQQPSRGQRGGLLRDKQQNSGRDLGRSAAYLRRRSGLFSPEAGFGVAIPNLLNLVSY